MFHSFINKIISSLTDWLIALVGVSLVIWFGLTLPLFSLTKEKSVENKPLLVSEAKLKTHVEILANYYAPRTIEYDTLNATARYIHKELSDIGDTHFQPYWTLNGRFSNVILAVGPNTPEILVIGAHYDAEDNSLDIDGNASGVSVLIELARHLTENEDKLSIGVQLVAYPLSQKDSVTIESMGSYQHAYSIRATKKKVKMMLSLDGVGSYSDESHSQKYPYKFMNYLYPDTGNFIGIVGRPQSYSQILSLKKSFNQASELPLYSFNLNASSYSKDSFDHLNYQRHGFPAMLITDTSEYRVIDKNETLVSERLDYGKMAMLVQGLYQVVIDSDSLVEPVTGLAEYKMDVNGKDIL